MKKAIITGLVTGVIISGLMIGGTYLRRFLPHTFTANLLFIIVFFGSIVSVLWLSLHYYSKDSAVRMRSLGLTGIISSIMAALLVTLHSFIYSRFSDPAYVDEIMQFSKQRWQKTNAAAESLFGKWLAPNMVWNNFRDLAILLFVTTLFIVVIYYLINRNRLPYSRKKENHELIY